MSTFSMVVPRRPMSANKGPNENYKTALSEAARFRHPTILDGPLYARILWFHKDKTNQDVDNIAKRILDSLKGVVFRDDLAVSHCLAARIDARIEYELDGVPPSEQEEKMLLELLGDDQTRNVLYIEIGPRTSSAASFGEVR